MKNTKLEIVRYLLGQKTYKSNIQSISHGDINVNVARKTSERYNRYF